MNSTPLRTARLIAVALAAAATVSLTAGTAHAATAATMSVRGVVSCKSAPVTSVTVKSATGGSWAATRTTYPRASSTARFSRSITTRLPNNISLAVKCGATTMRTPAVRVTGGSTLFFNADCTSACGLVSNGGNTPAAPSASWFSASQCTGRAAGYWKAMTGRFPNWSGDAGQWDDAAAAAGWTVRSLPRPDSIIVWQPNLGGARSQGHVGYISDTRVAGSTIQVKVYDRNWQGGDRNGTWINYVQGMKFIVAHARAN